MTFTLKQFQQKISFEAEKFNSALNYVKYLFKFPNYPRSEILQINITHQIKELSKLVFHPRVTDKITIDTEDLARRLADTIQSESWVDYNNLSTLSFVEQISSASTIIAAHYAVAMIPSSKYQGKKLCFRYSAVNLEKIAEMASVHKRTLWRWIKTIQNKLFEVYEGMHVRPGNIKNVVDIGKVLVEILDHIELIGDTSSISGEIELDKQIEGFVSRKEYLTKCLVSFLASENSFTWNKFLSYVKNLAECNMTFKTSSFSFDKRKGLFIFDTHQFHCQHIDLLKDLLENGCTVDELETKQISDLTKIYIESRFDLNDDLDDLLDQEVEAELDDYIKSPHEVKAALASQNFPLNY